MRDRFAVHLVKILASHAMRFNDIACYSIHDMLMLVQHCINDKVDRAEVQRLLPKWPLSPDVSFLLFLSACLLLKSPFSLRAFVILDISKT